MPVQRSDSGDLHIKRHATWGMSVKKGMGGKMFSYYLWVFKSDAYKRHPVRTLVLAAKLALNLALKRSEKIRVRFGSSCFTFNYIHGSRHAGGRGLFIFREDIEDLMRFGDQFIRRGDVVLDCGANQGVFTTAFANYVGETGTVVAFEPMGYAADLIEGNLKENKLDNCHIIRAAVSDKAGMCNFDLSAGVGSASISQNHGGSNVIEVETITIDSVLKNLGIETVDFVKLDVEGAELMALKGSKNLLSKCKPKICMEISPGDEADGAHDYLLKLGYKPLSFQGDTLSEIKQVVAATNVFYLPK